MLRISAAWCRLAKDAASQQRPHAKPASKQPESHSQLGAGGERRQQADGHAGHSEDQRAERVQASTFASQDLELLRFGIDPVRPGPVRVFMPIAEAIAALAARDAIVR